MIGTMLTMFAMLASMLALASAPAGASAQDEEPTGFLRMLDGLETAYARRYDPEHEHGHRNGVKNVSREATPSA